MTKSQKLIKIIFFSILIALSLTAFIFSIHIYDNPNIHHNEPYFTQYEFYGGDAYTGIQNAAADTSNNVKGLAQTVRESAYAILNAIIIPLIFIYSILVTVFAYLLVITCFTPATVTKENVADIAEDETEIEQKTQ